MIVYYGQISSFMINPNGNGLHPHVPSHATEFELALALIFKTGSTLLVHHWQPGGLELDNHCLYVRHCQYKSPFVCCSVCFSCWLAARGGTEHGGTEHAYIIMLEHYFGKLHNHCLQEYRAISQRNGLYISTHLLLKIDYVVIIIIIIIQLYFRPQWVHRKDNTNIQG